MNARMQSQAEILQEEHEFLCSVAQERFWLLDRLEPGNPAYNVAVRWRLEGTVSTPLLERAWLEILERHEILRSTFAEVNGAPVQRVHSVSNFRLQEIDLSAVAADQQQAEADKIGVTEARAPFDLESGPLVRAILLRFTPQLSVILVTTHQIVSDGWSIGVMAREMGVIYDALRNSQPVPLEPLSIQYADYSMWQTEWLKARGNLAETAYWSKQLAGVRPFKVIADKPRPAMPTTQGVIVSKVMPRAVTNAAQAACAERGATLFAAALGSLCAMLARYTKDSEIVVGTQVSDRNQIELEGMVGQFVNSLVLRNDLSGNPTFFDIIDRVRDTTEQALEHRNIPIEKLLGMVKGEHGKTNAAAISVNFIFQKTFIQNTKYTDFTLVDMPSLPAGAIYDLNFFMVERPDGWRFSLQYNTDQFEHATALRFIDYFERVLQTLATDPRRHLADVVLGAPNESADLLGRINAPAAVTTRTAAQLFAEQAAKTPAAKAISHAGHTLSYGELLSLSENMGSALRARGIGLGSQVAILLPRSPELVALLFGLMKIGAAGVMLDANDSRARRERMLRGVNPAAIIVNRETRAAAAEDSLLTIDIASLAGERTAGRQLAAQPEVPSQAAAFLATNLDAAVGHSLTQATLGSVLAEVAQRIELRAGESWLASAPLGLDVAVPELLLPLSCGATLVMAEDRDLESGRQLLQFLKRTEIHAMHALPETYASLQRGGWVPHAGLKAVSSGDELSAATLQHLLQHNASVWAVLGTAERGGWTAINRIANRLDESMVGAPLGGVRLSVKDAQGRVADVGASGALCVDAGGGERITGDVARLRAEGSIQLLGHSDRLFRLSGHRIDPATLEALLKEHPQVSDARVGKGEQTFRGQLVCAVTVRDAESVSAVQSELTQRLGETLPYSLDVSMLANVAPIPLEREGRFNWRALQVWSRGPAAPAEGQPNKARAGIEESLAAIWKGLLNVEQIDPEANFFELGGHSLLAARMLARVEATFNRRVTLNTLFGAPTIRELAEILSQHEAREFDFRQLVKLQPNGNKVPLIAINNTGTYYPLAKRMGQDQPVISLQVFDPSVRLDALPATLEEVASRYVELIQRVQPTGPYNLMGWCVAGALSFEVARQLAQAGQKVDSLFLMDSWLPGYIRRLPYLRRMVCDYSLRWQMIRADWRLVEQKRKVINDFLASRNGIRKLLTLWKHIGDRLMNRNMELDESEAAKELSREDYDKWLLAYLQSITAKYEPAYFPGRLTLFRSYEEPTGWMFDPLAGWGKYADKVELHMVPGDHYTMFREGGAQLMAEKITDTIASAQDRPS